MLFSVHKQYSASEYTLIGMDESGNNEKSTRKHPLFFENFTRESFSLFVNVHGNREIKKALEVRQAMQGKIHNKEEK